MPILHPSENPPIKPAVDTGVAEMQGTWWVAHTKSRCEKKLAWDLLRKGISYFLPMAMTCRVSGGRRRRVLNPLFPGYVFVCGTDEDRYDTLLTDRVCQIIDVYDPPTLVTELSWIERTLASGAAVLPCETPVEGTKWRVTTGPFEGIVGTLIGVKAEMRLVLTVSMLGQGASLEVDMDLLEPAE